MLGNPPSTVQMQCTANLWVFRLLKEIHLDSRWRCCPSLRKANHARPPAVFHLPASEIPLPGQTRFRTQRSQRDLHKMQIRSSLAKRLKTFHCFEIKTNVLPLAWDSNVGWYLSTLLASSRILHHPSLSSNHSS